MKRIAKTNLFEVVIDGVTSIVNVIGTYRDHKTPIIRVENGPLYGCKLAINPLTGDIIKKF